MSYQSIENRNSVELEDAPLSETTSLTNLTPTKQRWNRLYLKKKMPVQSKS